ncbi:MAG: bifunctional riboflavin kinase/FAD synthetase [Gammaproteobacteria bacterium]|nr:MAG: bifunctional riboflavin kinase/FAD synthetase [Gammaproteobacteria bacterium]
MQLIRRPGSGRPALPGGCVATIGTFDGVHLGHQRIIARVVEEARRRGLPAVVFSFEPTPAEFFSPGRPPPRLTRFREKFVALAELAVDCFFCPPFDAAMESLSPAAFIQRWLLEALQVQHLVVGDDFRFGHRRAGGFAELQQAAAEHGFGIERAESVVVDGQRVSSTAIREALAAGELERARRLLGRYYRMLGRVVPGRRLGARLGFPTANVRLNRRAVALSGIFAVRVHGLPESPVDGVASLGYRPTVDRDGTLLLEVHLFDFDRDIYGEHIGVDFVARLRDERRFDDLDSLVEQMHEDAAQARALLAAADEE